MADRRITARDLAAKAGLSRNYLGKRLRDEASLTSNDIEAICKALDIDILTFATAAIRRMRR
jgi:transcriptional regulator with XRE-family HTH domain